MRGAPRGQPVQALVNRADREFDFTPYQVASDDYTSTLSKLRRKSVLRKFKDDPDGALVEISSRSESLSAKIDALLSLYGPFFDEATTAAFVDNLALRLAPLKTLKPSSMPSANCRHRATSTGRLATSTVCLSARPISLRPSPTIAPCGKSPGGRCPSVSRSPCLRTRPTCCASPSLIWGPERDQNNSPPISATASRPTKFRQCPWASPPSS